MGSHFSCPGHYNLPLKLGLDSSKSVAYLVHLIAYCTDQAWILLWPLAHSGENNGTLGR